MRVLIAGSRTWTDAVVIAEALQEVSDGSDLVIVHGDCPTGADNLADYVARTLGLPVERYPADWSRHDESCPDWHKGLPTCKMAGFRRNAEMVDLGADVCLAFQRNGSKGTQSTIDLARKAGIPTYVYKRTDMSNEEIRNYAKTFAEEHLGTYDYLGVHEMLELEGVEFTDEDVEKIFDLIIHAKVVLGTDQDA